ncbi:MAG: hypothetical protein JRI97_10955 [Deltaproteobacteria bacterium]|nr:hypothetical protein [Deltaproteobacteria bacterium]
MKNAPPICVALSGGADSMAAALLLAESGQRVVGIHFSTGFEPQDGARPSLAAEALGIPLVCVDLSPAFRGQVILRFARAYARGETPNPCMACNRRIKFAALAAEAREQGAAALATGHYARLEQTPSGPALYKGADKTRDQSYFLALVRRRDLSFARFPLARHTKDQVRELTGTTRPFWSAWESPCPGKGTSWTRRETSWAGTRESTATPWGSAGVWAARTPGPGTCAPWKGRATGCSWAGRRTCMLPAWPCGT